jgi:hypothetical protein
MKKTLTVLMLLSAAIALLGGIGAAHIQNWSAVCWAAVAMCNGLVAALANEQR